MKLTQYGHFRFRFYFAEVQYGLKLGLSSRNFPRNTKNLVSNTRVVEAVEAVDFYCFRFHFHFAEVQYGLKLGLGSQNFPKNTKILHQIPE